MNLTYARIKQFDVEINVIISLVHEYLLGDIALNISLVVLTRKKLEAHNQPEIVLTTVTL